MSQAPDLADLIRRSIESRLEDVHTSAVGKVLSYDSATQTADIQPMVQRVVPGDEAGNLQAESFPHIPNVPVIFLRTKTFESHFELEVGDSVLLLFLARSIAEWRATGVESTPGDVRLHSLGNVVALPGVFPDLLAMSGPVLVSDPYQGKTLGPKVIYKNSAIEVRDNVGVASPVALATLVDAALAALLVAITAAATTETAASGLGGMSALMANLAAWPPPPGTACQKLKAQ